MPIQLIIGLIIVGALGLQFGAFKLQKHINDKKVKKLNDDLYEKTVVIENLKKEKEIRVREQKAGVAHRERINMTRKESNEIEFQIDKAHTPAQIDAIVRMIDKDNNFRVRS